MSYTHPQQDAAFVLRHLIQFDDLCSQLNLQEVNAELALTVLDEAGKLGADVIAPLNREGDLQGASIDEQGVHEVKNFKAAYWQLAEGGWLSLTADENYGGQGLPNVLGTAVNEIWQSANLAFALCPLLSVGAMASISHHGSDWLKQTFLPRMTSGEWTGTMNLTESDAGSDLAAVKTRAVPDGDAYKVSGQKIFITWGDHQMTENIVHLVLARLPDAPAGVKGISLFIVPKFNVDAEGTITDRNAVNCLSIEHKLGIHGSPTCVMEFKDAKGYLVGEANKGLMYMFTMMNHARQAVGVQGLSISERAYQQAVQYAKDRLQGTRRDGSRIPIIEHPDVRRMLMSMKSSTEAMRALALTAAAEMDRAHCDNAAEHNARVELFTPIVKGWCTEMSLEMTSLNVQVHGGMGFIEETGAAQHYRDARILTIYEGTSGIQALDLVGRKTLMDGGKALNNLLNEIQGIVDALEASHYPEASLTHELTKALAAGRQALDLLLTRSQQDEHFAGSVSYSFMMLMGYLCGGWLMAKSALKAHELMSHSDEDGKFLVAKQVTARFFCEQLLPRTASYLSAIESGSACTMALSNEQF